MARKLQREALQRGIIEICHGHPALKWLRRTRDLCEAALVGNGLHLMFTYQRDTAVDKGIASSCAAPSRVIFYLRCLSFYLRCLIFYLRCLNFYLRCLIFYLPALPHLLPALPHLLHALPHLLFF